MRWCFCVVFLIAVLATLARGEGPPEANPKIPIPESGFLSPQQYTNAFFGFALPLPKGHHFQVEDLSLSEKPLQHFLFAQKSTEKGITMLVVTAHRVLGSGSDEAQKVVVLPGQTKSGPEALNIGGRLFWKNRVEQKTMAGKLFRFRYASWVPGYVLLFSASSYNERLIDEMSQNVEAVKFFDPAQARQVAGAASQPFIPQSARMRLTGEQMLDLAHLDPGHITGDAYTNSFLGFSFEFPRGWSIRDSSKTNDGMNVRASLNSSTPKADSLDACMRVLFSASKYPPEIQTEDFNSRTTIVAADPACFAPDLKFPESVRDEPGLELLGTALARAFAGTALVGPQLSSLRAVDLGGHMFLELPSFAAVPVPGSRLLRKVHKSFVLTSMRQYWVIWLFESDTESELGKLMRASVSFEPATASAGASSH